MNLDSTVSPTVVTIEVQYSDYPGNETALQRWQVYHRLRELEISCRCAAHQPLTIQVNSAIAAFQLWSVVKQVSTSRLELVDWLERCWRLR
ncbi:MAG: hypothetical protein LH660_07830 [Phormidesmis sp. CAN_BIN36]|nr:hypothetical protein [Phormidesmis sp. CAN_BIN36]